MAGRKITQLPTLTTPEATDKLVIVDVSDTSESPQGTSKQIAFENLVPYKSYVALLTQTGTSAPTINVLENTTGITFTASYDDEGFYFLTPSVPPNANKTTVLGANASGSGFIGGMFWREGVVNITTVDSDSAPANGVLSNSTIEIRVYP